jgi:hypothetical protein
MERVNVMSSNIVAIGYDAGSCVREVEFKGGEVYQYIGVPAQHHTGLMNAESHGKYLNAHIKGKYPYRQVL